MKRVFTPKTKKVLFFDLNQTLIDQHLSFQTHFIQLLNDYAGRWSEQEREWTGHSVYKAYVKEMKRLERKSRYKNRTRKEMKQLSLKKALAPYPFDVDEHFAANFFEQLRKRQVKEPMLFAKVIPTLQKLSRSYRLAIISNSSKFNLTELGLSDLFPEKYIFTAKKCGVRKPNARIFKTALQTMKVQPEHAVMIGNSYRKDVQPAIRCGMDAIWVQRIKSKHRPIRRIGKRKIVRIERIGQITSLFSLK